MNMLSDIEVDQITKSESISEKLISSIVNYNELLELEKKIPEKIIAGEVDKLTHIFSCVSDQQINGILTFEGFFDKEIMSKALLLSMYAEPVLGCRFVVMPDEAYWKRRADLLKLIPCAFVKTQNLEQDIHEFVISEIDPREDLPIRLKFFETKEGHTMCIKVSHEVLDGGGIQDFLALLSKIYNELVIDPNYIPEPNLDNDRSLKQVFKQLNFFQKFKVMLSLRIRKPTWRFPWKGTEHKTRDYKIHKIAPNEYRQLKAYSKRKGVTITDIIITAFNRAMFLLTTPPVGKTMLSTITVNLRSYMPNYKAKSLCNLTCSSHPKLSLKIDETFEESLLRIHKSTQKLKRQGPGLEAAMFLRILFSLKYAKSKEILEDSVAKELKLGATFPIITNIGLVESKDIDFTGLKATDGYIITPFIKAPGFIMGTITFEKTLRLSIAYFKEAYDSALVSDFLEIMAKEMINGTKQ